MKVRKLFSITASYLYAVAYGLLIVAVLNALHASGDGDVVRYVNFFEDQDLEASVENFSLRSDGVFRVGINAVKDLFSAETITVLSMIAFFNSTVIVILALLKIQSEKKAIVLLPLFSLVLLSPMVVMIFSDQIRSTLAFSVFLISLIFTKGLVRYGFFLLLGGLHFAMIPLIFLFFGFHILAKLGLKSDFLIRIGALISVSVLFCLVAAAFQFNVTNTFQGNLYNLAIFYIMTMMILINREAIKNVYGFMSLGLMLIYFSGQVLDIAFVRYVSYAIVLYLFFLIERGQPAKVVGFTLVYVPFFALNVVYKLSNIGVSL